LLKLVVCWCKGRYLNRFYFILIFLYFSFCIFFFHFLFLETFRYCLFTKLTVQYWTIVKYTADILEIIGYNTSTHWVQIQVLIGYKYKYSLGKNTSTHWVQILEIIGYKYKYSLGTNTSNH